MVLRSALWNRETSFIPFCFSSKPSSNRHVTTRRQGVHPQDRRLVWACVHTGYEPCNNTLHPKYTSLNFNHRPTGFQKQKYGNFAISPTYNIPQKCCAAGPEKEESRRPTQQARRIYANAAQQARRNEKSRRPTQQARGLATSQHFNNILNPRLYASSAYLGLNIYSPVHIDNLNTSDNSEVSKRRMRSLLFLSAECAAPNAQSPFPSAECAVSFSYKAPNAQSLFPYARMA